jgi:hypothetical protein
MPQAQASSGRDFIRSVVYGTLAGTLVGVATLAFTTNPGDNLNNVARGASYGLYAGIMLGVWINQDDGNGPNGARGYDEPVPTDEPPPPENPPPPDALKTPPFMPMIVSTPQTGTLIGASFRVLEF